MAPPRARIVVLALLPWLAACAPSQEAFPRRYGEVFCSRYAECYKADFDAYYDDMDECVDDQEESVDDVLGACDYDPDDALDCLDEVVHADCDDMVERATACLLDTYECSLSDLG